MGSSANSKGDTKTVKTLTRRNTIDTNMSSRFKLNFNQDIVE